MNLAVKAKAQLGYQSTVVQSGASYQIAKWRGRDGAYTALDLMGSARYWHEELDVSLNVTGTLTADIQKLGLVLQRSKSLAVAHSGALEWVDPVVGARLRHQMASGAELTLIGDVGGFGAGSDFSWQAVATYGFDVNCFGTPLRTVVGYRALAVDYSENGRFGKNGLDRQSIKARDQGHLRTAGARTSRSGFAIAGCPTRPAGANLPPMQGVSPQSDNVRNGSEADLMTLIHMSTTCQTQTVRVKLWPV